MQKKGKVALISVWNHNYGSLLQTYAMQQYLNSNDFSNEIIKYSEKNYLRRLLRFTNLNYTRSKFKLTYRNFYLKIFYREVNARLKQRSIKFEQFKNENLFFSTLITNRTRLKKIIKNYDIALLGSDQVLHPSNLLMNYFNLNFVPLSIKKIGYAPSFGVSSIPKCQKNRTKAYLNSFNHLSIRENVGQGIVRDLVKREVPVVCDPTLLVSISVWEGLIDNNKLIKEDYIFCYFLGNNEHHRVFADDLKKVTGLKLVTLKYLDEFVKYDLKFGDYSPFDIGPKEFVNLISKASYVLTDSFHASIFSILFQRKFFTFNRFSNKNNTSTNSRIYSLLGQLNLKDRLISGLESADELYMLPIDYNHVNRNIDEIRGLSEEFIIKALNN